MGNTKIYIPQFRDETTIIEQYLIKLHELVGKQCINELLVARGSNGMESKAWRFILNSVQNPELVRIGGIFDWDDTLEPYTKRKLKFYNTLTVLIPDSRKELSSRVIKICKALNKAARILPEDGTHPEHYSPKLDLIALTILFDSINAGKLPELLENIKEQSDKENDEKIAREFIHRDVLGKFGNQIKMVSEVKKNVLKMYFREVINQSVSLNPSEKPKEVDTKIWNIYHRVMMGSNIPQNELQNFDLPLGVRFIVATFGEIGFQLEKIINSIKELKLHNQRIPDEILVFLKGRKEPIIESVVNLFPNTKFVYVDDSPRQLDGVVNIDRTTPIHAFRKGAKRSGERAHTNIKVVDMATKTLSDIILS
jgi:hypothetical protein